MIKAIIYDLDGVLVDATEWHYEALNRALRVFGHQITREEHTRFYNGLPTRKKLEVFSKERGFPETLKEDVNQLKQVYTQNEIYLKCKPSFEKEYALSKFKNEGFKQVVCSNSIRESIMLMLTKSNIIRYIDFFIGNDEVPNPKPSPDMFTLAMDRLGLKPNEVLIIEDSPHGVEAAKKSGARVFVVNNIHEVTYFNIKNFLTSLGD